jgi:hypothetical protein
VLIEVAAVRRLGNVGGKYGEKFRDQIDEHATR